MNTSQIPQVELIQGPTGHPADSTGIAGRRWKIFLAVLLTGAVLGAALVYSRAPVYRAVASVLTVKPKAVDSRSAEADIEHVAIQSRLLLSPELLSRLAARLRGDGIAADPRDLESVLAISPVADTNLLELRAEGGDPAQLQTLVNRWTETYEDYRAEEIEAATGRTTTELEQQQAVLQARIDSARRELQVFRETHDIVGLERGENASLAKLNNLNRSLGNARERLTDAESRMAAVEAAIAAGETVVPREQKADIARMQTALERNRAQLAELRQRYTQKYIDRDPVLRELPSRVSAMQGELNQALALARRSVRDEAKQEVDAARLSLASLEQQLAEHERNVQVFNAQFQQYESLQGNLERLDALYADNTERLTQIQMQGFQKYPQIQVVEWAREPTTPIRPDYERDMLIALGVSFGLALFVTWLVEYLGGRASRVNHGPMIGVRIAPPDAAAALSQARADALQVDQRWVPLAGPVDTPPEAAPDTTARYLDADSVRKLMAESGRQVRAHIALLLSGVSPTELEALEPADLDADQRRIHIGGNDSRTLSLAEPAWHLLQPLTEDDPGRSRTLPADELDNRLRQAAMDAGLEEPDDVDAWLLWHSYLWFLLGQNATTDELQARLGRVGAAQQAQLATADLAPVDGDGLRPINWTHPALAG
jgi:uncharacterized protein involved in exopolysaccharide biosynthesis